MNQKWILLVEDSPDDEALTLRALRKSDVREDVTVAHDGVEALEFLFSAAARDASALPAVVFLDLKLPKVNGLEVLERVRADRRTRLVPVVVLTSSNEECDVAGCYRLGANSYVRKPLDSAEFAGTVGLTGNYWLRLNEPLPPAGRM